MRIFCFFFKEYIIIQISFRCKWEAQSVGKKWADKKLIGIILLEDKAKF